MRVEHRFDWGRTPKGKRYAMCTCGWRAPARAKLTHGMSDVRDHMAAVKRQCAAEGWRWWMVDTVGLVTEEPARGRVIDQVEDDGVSLPTDVGGR